MWKWLGITDEVKTTVESSSLTKKEGSENQNNEETKLSGEGEITSEKVRTDAQQDPSLKDVAANLGSYLYTFADAATKTASKLKEKVDHKLEEKTFRHNSRGKQQTIVGDFKRENERFIQEKEERRIGDAVPPWEGYHEEDTLKSQILALSSDERNFLRDPPAGVEFHFEVNHKMPVAMATLKADKALEEMRFKLVPKKVKEERFWRNYFYRVSLIKQSTQLSTLAENEIRNSTRTSSSESLNKTPSLPIAQPEHPDETTINSPTTHNEFISDNFEGHEEHGLSEEEKQQMLGLSENVSATEATGESQADVDWEIEKELQEELESFELVNEDAENDGQWEKEIEDLLENETS